MSNLKVVKACYIIDSAFCIPKNIDLDDKTQVKDWGVKWNKLFITLTNGKELEIEATIDNSDFDFKYPTNTKVIDAETYGFCIDEDDEEFEEVEIDSDN